MKTGKTVGSKRLITLLIAVFYILLINPVFSSEELLVVNLKTHIYHKFNCPILNSCKDSCLTTTKQRAIEVYEARPCKFCYRSKVLKKHQTKQKHHKKYKKHHKKHRNKREN